MFCFLIGPFEVESERERFDVKKLEKLTLFHSSSLEFFFLLKKHIHEQAEARMDAATLAEAGKRAAAAADAASKEKEKESEAAAEAAAEEAPAPAAGAGKENGGAAAVAPAVPAPEAKKAAISEK